MNFIQKPDHVSSLKSLTFKSILAAVLLCQSFTPSGQTVALAAGQPAVPTTESKDAGLELLLRVAASTADIHSLSASFTQEKKLSMLDDPLLSSGLMCLERDPAPTTDVADSGGEKVFWAYTEPSVSGFAYENGQGWLWTDDRAKTRRAQGMEGTALKAVTEHILAWVRVRPEALRKVYSMERLPDVTEPSATPGSPTGPLPVLRLMPRQANSFFSELVVTFAPELDSVRSLRFVEKNGDVATLFFSNVRINAPLPPQCQGTAAP